RYWPRPRLLKACSFLLRTSLNLPACKHISPPFGISTRNHLINRFLSLFYFLAVLGGSAGRESAPEENMRFQRNAIKAMRSGTRCSAICLFYFLVYLYLSFWKLSKRPTNSKTCPIL